MLKLAVYSAVLANWLCASPVAAQITDPARWLVQGRCADGSSPDHCHSTIGTDTSIVQNFRFADGGFGGQALHINGNVVLAYKTQDAGKTNTYYFTGPNCGGSGWIMFDVDVPKG